VCGNGDLRPTGYIVDFELGCGGAFPTPRSQRVSGPTMYGNIRTDGPRVRRKRGARAEGRHRRKPSEGGTYRETAIAPKVLITEARGGYTSEAEAKPLRSEASGYRKEPARPSAEANGHRQDVARYLQRPASHPRSRVKLSAEDWILASEALITVDEFPLEPRRPAMNLSRPLPDTGLTAVLGVTALDPPVPAWRDRPAVRSSRPCVVLTRNAVWSGITRSPSASSARTRGGGRLRLTVRVPGDGPNARINGNADLQCGIPGEKS